MRVYYNEIDPFAVAWLRELMKAGAIPTGDIDTRSIKDVQAHDVRGYEQAHFFAGIGGWPYALQLAGWGDRPVWTGSCPCQPFSAAGKRKGTADTRHLWPDFHRLIAECAPATVFGEQVASKDGRIWLAGVRADLEALAYAVGAADLCAAGVSAPHIRQRLYWVADADRRQRNRLTGGEGRERDRTPARWIESNSEFERDSTIGGLAYSNGGDTSAKGLQRSGQYGQQPQDGGSGGLEHAESDGRQQRGSEPSGGSLVGGCGEGFWSDFDPLPCTDGKTRRVEPGSFPLAHGVPKRVGRLRGYGNAIVPQVAAEFVGAFLEC